MHDGEAEPVAVGREGAGQRRARRLDELRPRLLAPGGDPVELQAPVAHLLDTEEADRAGAVRRGDDHAPQRARGPARRPPSPPPETSDPAVPDPPPPPAPRGPPRARAVAAGRPRPALPPRAPVPRP